MQSKKDNSSTSVGSVTDSLWAAGTLLGLAVVGYQVFAWLKSGVWPPLTVSTVVLPLARGSGFAGWYANPTGWYGVHRVMEFLLNLPLWCGCVVAGAASAARVRL